MNFPIDNDDDAVTRKTVINSFYCFIEIKMRQKIQMRNPLSSRTCYIRLQTYMLDESLKYFIFMLQVLSMVIIRYVFSVIFKR